MSTSFYLFRRIFLVGNQKLGGPMGYLKHQESDELQDTRNLRDEDLRTLAQVREVLQKLSESNFEI